MSGGAGSLRTGIAVMAACAGLLLGASPAVAATVTGPTNGLAITTIDEGRTVHLTVHLARPNPFDDPVPEAPPPGPLAGTEFTVRQLEGVDLTTAAGWARARSMTIPQAQRGPFHHVADVVTDSAGEAHFSGLPVGLYLVTSIPPDQFHEYPESAPFLITLPTGGGAGWNYAPLLYAKPWPAAPTTPGTAPPSAPPSAPPAGADSAVDATPSEGASRPGALASTGAAVAILAGAALVLAGIGLLIRFFARRRDSAGT